MTDGSASVQSPNPEASDAAFQCFQRNLEALAVLQPELARRLRALAIPATVEPACGRDGSATFRIVGDGGRRCWLGGSSMPSISAPAILEPFDHAGANILIPTVGTGWEMDLLCQRTPPHVAVFVYEADPLSLKLALHVRDVAGHLRGGRLILLSFEPIEAALPAFFARHPGYDPPQKMLVHPSTAPQALEGIRIGSEAASAVVISHQCQAAGNLAAALAKRGQRAMPEAPRVALFSADPRPHGMRLVRHLSGALAELNWPVVAGCPDSPWNCHTLTRLAMIHEHRADLVVTLNACAGRLAEFLPPDLPVASWFWPDTDAIAALGGGFVGHHHFFAATPEQCEQVRAGGASPERVHLLEVGVDTAAYRPVKVPEDRRERLTCDVAVLTDAPPCSADALGITLESHVRLWDFLGAMMGEYAPKYRPSLAPQMVAEAERGCGVELGSPELRDRLVRLVQGPLARRKVTAAAVANARGFGLTIKLWGHGWEDEAEMREVLAGSIPDGPACNEIYQCAAAVMIAVPDVHTPQVVLEVLAAGGVPIVPSPAPEFGAAHPQLAEVLGSIPQYDRFKSLISLLRDATLPDKTLKQRMVAVRETVVTRHSLSCRFKVIGDTLRDE